MEMTLLDTPRNNKQKPSDKREGVSAFKLGKINIAECFSCLCC